MYSTASRLHEIEQLGSDVYRRLGLDESVPVDTFRLARLLFGDDSIEYLDSVRASTYVAAGRRRITIHSALCVADALHAIGHEIGHAVRHELSFEPDNVERICDVIGDVLMAPAPAVRRLVALFGPDPEAISAAVAADTAWSTRRIAQVESLDAAPTCRRRERGARRDSMRRAASA